MAKLLHPATSHEKATRTKNEKAYEQNGEAAAAEAWAALTAIGQAVTGLDGYDAKGVADAFFARAATQSRAPQKSTRFYPIAYEAYLRRWQAWLNSSLAMFDSLEPHVQGDLPHGSSHNRWQKAKINAGYFAEVSRMLGALDFFRGDQQAENFMLCPRRYALVALDARLVCLVDISSDLLGSNSQCPFYLSAVEDGTTFDISEWNVWSNPPFKDS